MTIAGKINTLILVVAGLSMVLLTLLTAQQEYQVYRNDLLRQISAEVASQPQLQLHVYYQDEPALLGSLQSFLALSPAVSYAIIHDTDGIDCRAKTVPGPKAMRYRD